MPNEVRVYEDPHTMQRFEGSATVLRVIRPDEPCSLCRVRFLSGPPPQTLDRWVDNDQLRSISKLPQTR